MYVITSENKLVELKGSLEKQLNGVEVKAVVITNSQDPLNNYANQILRWCNCGDFKDTYQNILQSAQSLQPAQ